MQDGHLNGEQQQDALSSAMEALEQRLGPQLEQVRQTMDQLNQRARQVVRERPGTSLLLAVGVGFLIGRLASRR